MAGSSSSSSNTKTWCRNDIPNLAGKFAIVTGGSRGIGYETAIGLVAAGADVIIVGRDEAKGIEAVEKMKETYSKIIISFIKVDLGSLTQIKEFAKYVQFRKIRDFVSIMFAFNLQKD